MTHLNFSDSRTFSSVFSPNRSLFRVFTFGRPISVMPIHRRTLGVRVSVFNSLCGWLVEICIFTTQTRRGSVTGCLWQRVPRRNVVHAFDADIPMQATTIHPPYVDVEGSFSMPTVAPPEVFDTIIQLPGHKLLVSGYFDHRLEQNVNLKRDFPFITWRGEIAVLFVGKRKHFLNRGPPGSIIHLAIAQ